MGVLIGGENNIRHFNNTIDGFRAFIISTARSIRACHQRILHSVLYLNGVLDACCTCLEILLSLFSLHELVSKLQEKRDLEKSTLLLTVFGQSYEQQRSRSLEDINSTGWGTQLHVGRYISRCCQVHQHHTSLEKLLTISRKPIDIIFIGRKTSTESPPKTSKYLRGRKESCLSELIKYYGVSANIFSRALVS